MSQSRSLLCLVSYFRELESKSVKVVQVCWQTPIGDLASLQEKTKQVSKQLLMAVVPWSGSKQFGNWNIPHRGYTATVITMVWLDSEPAK